MNTADFNDPAAARNDNPAVTAWLEKAVDDLQLARRLLKDKLHFDAICFHSQQAAEKTLKALIESRGQRPPKIHDLVHLDELVRGLAPGWSFNIRELSDLSGSAVESRYPGARATLADAEEAFRIASSVWIALRPLL